MIKKDIFGKTKLKYIKWFLNTKGKKIKNKKNYNSNNKTKLKIFSNVRGQYPYSRTKPRGIALNIMQYNDVRSDDTVRSIITFAIRWQQNSTVNRNLTSVLNIWNNCFERF